MSDTGFEEALTELERRVRLLEAGEIPLEEALRHYEEGVALARRAHELLDAAEVRVAALKRSAGGITEDPLPEPRP